MNLALLREGIVAAALTWGLYLCPAAASESHTAATQFGCPGQIGNFIDQPSWRLRDLAGEVTTAAFKADLGAEEAALRKAYAIGQTFYQPFADSPAGPIENDELYSAIHLATLLTDESRYPEADRMLSPVVARLETEANAAAAFRGQAAQALGDLRMAQGRAEDAMTLFDKAQACFQRVGDTRAQAAVLVSRADSLPAAGDAALAALQQSLKLDPDAVRAHQSLAWHAMQRQDLTVAAAEMDRADALLKRDHGPYWDKTPEYALGLTVRGAIARQRGRLAEAEALYRRSLDAFHTLYGAQHYRVASLQIALGEVLQDGALTATGPAAAAKRAEALQLYSDAARSMAALFGENSARALEAKNLSASLLRGPSAASAADIHQ